ncbi:HhH-GPD-type base excision DNA repair protein [Phytohabitans sp. LJ34]|uniref:HhH-GPD-type base excision DNA repair protein n=1 Tax=Phytohabitans sp. LJ34 TaxID=3452217 RepID=UPI003F88C7B7
MTLNLPIDAEANKLLQRSPLALLVGMILDQQFPLERAFSAPYELSRRLGHEPTAEELADFDPEALTAIFATPPALHRFPKAMAARVQEACRIVVDTYGGEAENIWTGAADGKDLYKRVSALPGFGKQKAQIFVALLGKRFGVRPEGWREAAGGYGPEGTYKSVADIVDAAALVKVREYKQEMKAAAKK